MPLPQEILESIPEEYRENETLNRFNEVGDLAKSYVELRSKQGRSITIPGKDAPESDRKQFLESLINNAEEVMMKPDFADKDQADEFWRTIGKPESGDKYTLPEGVEFPDEAVTKMRQIAFDANMTGAQFEKWISTMHEDHVSNTEALSSKQEEDTAALKTKWGLTFDDRVKQAEKMHDQFPNGKQFGELSAAEIESYHGIATALTGKGAPAAHQEGGGQTGMTPDEARDRIAEIERKVFDKENPPDPHERMRLINKTIDLKRKYLPEFAEAS